MLCNTYLLFPRKSKWVPFVIIVMVYIQRVWLVLIKIPNKDRIYYFIDIKFCCKIAIPALHIKPLYHLNPTRVGWKGGSFELLFRWQCDFVVCLNFLKRVYYFIILVHRIVVSVPLLVSRLILNFWLSFSCLSYDFYKFSFAFYSLALLKKFKSNGR